MQTVVLTWAGQFVAGVVAGGLAMWLACLIFKRANRIAVFYSLATFVVVLTALALLARLGTSQIASLNTVEIIASAVGTISMAYFIARPDEGFVRLNLQDVKTAMAGILRPSVHTTRPGRLRGSA